MSYATIKGTAATELYPNTPFTDANGIQHPGNWLELSTPEMRVEAEVFDIVEPPAAPEGKTIVPQGLALIDGVPHRVYDVIDTPAPVVRVPERVTNSDWRVALIQMGKLNEVTAKVNASNVPNNLIGQIAYQRFEYANEVYLSELMSFKDVFGFTEAEVNESMFTAAAVSAS